MMKRLRSKVLSGWKNSLWMLLVIITTVAYGQSSVSGTITDENGDGIPGATVLVEGTSTGTISDLDGKFNLTLPQGAKNLVISYLGYATQTIEIAGKSSFTVVLAEDAETLSEVVVVGYGTQKRTDLTGAIASADSRVLAERGVTSPTQALQGSIAGVQINSSTGRVGDQMTIAIRGNNSLQSGASPLYVVDGVITSNIDFLNPQDIAKIDVLKDASSAAIYGSRGANGVVIITTKNGVNIPSGTNISVETFYGVKKVARLPQMMSPEKWAHYHMSAYMQGTKATTPEEFYQVVLPDAKNSVLQQRFADLDGFDWYDAVLQDGMQSNTHLSINHRSGASAYSLGMGFQNETGNIQNEGLKKYTMRLSMDQKISDRVQAGANFSMSLNNIQRGSALAMQEAFRLNPFLSPWAVDENGQEIVGELWPQPGKLLDPTGKTVIDKTSTYNPLLEIKNSSDETRQWNGLGSTFLQYQPTEWLSLRSTLSTGLLSYRRGVFNGAETNAGINNGKLPSSSLSNYESFNYTWDNQANLKKDFKQHSFNLLLLQSIYANRIEESSLSSTKQPFETDFYNVGSGPQSTYNLGSNFVRSQLSSFAMKLNYSLQDKYLVTLSQRWDGASVLADGYKWNSYPAVGLAWKISNEAFMPETNLLSNLKLRASYGQTGSNNVPAYSSVNTLDQQTYYDFSGSTANGWVASNLANKTLTWESTTEKNLGLDFSLLNYRINGTVDIYNRLSEGLLVPQKLPLETGYSSTYANAASIKNSGVELSLSSINIENNLIKWETTLTFSKNNNSIQSLYGQDKVDDVGNGWFIGKPVNVHYNYKFDGIWQAGETDAATYNQTEGQAKVVDVNKNGKIDPDDDRVFLGSPTPDWIGGLTSRLTVGAFDFNVTVYSSQGSLVYSNFHANFENMGDRGRQKLDIADWYIPVNTLGVEPQTSTSYPQPKNEGTYWNNNGVGYYKDASYAKVQNISLGYTLPSNLLKKMKVDYLRIYVNVLNPFVFTDYTGWDPEWANADYAVGRVSNRITQAGMSLKF